MQYFQCAKCKQEDRIVREGEPGAPCPRHGLPLEPVGDLQDLYHQMFKKEKVKP